MSARQLASMLAIVMALGQPAFARTAIPPAANTEMRGQDEAALRQVFAEDAERQDALDPVGALTRGGTTSAETLGRLFTDSLDRDRLEGARESLAGLDHVDRARLSPEARISYDVFRQAAQDRVEDLRPEIRALTGVRPFNHFGGLHVEFPALMSASGSLPWQTAADYREALELDEALADVLLNAELRFREGMAGGVTESKLTVRIMISQLDALLAQDPEESPFYSPTGAFPETFPPELRDELRAAFAAAIRDRIDPAYRRFRNFLEDEYLPAARDEIGLSAMRGGDMLYRRLIRSETTLDLEPDEIHRIGLSEVARIRQEMESVKDQLGFAGDLSAFFRHVRNDPRFHPRSREELAESFENVASEVDKRIPDLFAATPKARLVITPYPAFREQYEPGGGYYQGAADGSRPGTFYYNTFDLESRFLSGTTTLYLHEGAPGHHFQISLAQENEELPGFQRFDGNTAYVEGWALYAETLGYEMGLYDDPVPHWGTLDDEMLRAMRLVVDTGIHAKGWSREQAIAYMLGNSGMGTTDATSEVDRYIAIPAQALAYKLGALTIQELRRKAETELGEKFDIRAFHEQVLGSGALPLPILRAKIENWISATR